MRHSTLASTNGTTTANTTIARIAVRTLLAAVLALGGMAFAVPAHAEEPSAPEGVAADETIFAPLAFDPQEVYGGDCGVNGNNVTWSLDTATETLTISGTGEMADFVYPVGPYSSSAPWTAYRSSLSHLIITNGVTSIGDQAFHYCTNLATISIPASLASIGEHALNNCTGLTSISVDPNNATYSSDSSGVLFNKAKTQLVQFPNASQTSYTIPSGVTSIGNYAFYGGDSLTTVTIPSGVASIGDSAFYECTSLSSVTISPGVASIEHDAFRGTSLTSVIIPSSVASIGYGAFEECRALTSVTISPGVEAIEDYAFSWCSRLSDVTIPSSVKSIGEGAFYLCYYLTAITIPYGVITIGDSAFSRTSLATVNIPASVTTIGARAFRYCAYLTTITIPASVTTIGRDVFEDCEGPIYCAASSQPSGWSDEWRRFYNGAYYFGVDVPTGSYAHTVIFDTAGGSIVGAKQIDDGTPIGSLPVPTRAGYEFVGWFTAASGGTQITADTPITTSVTLYAHWLRFVTQHEGDNRQDTAARASAKAYPDPTQVDNVILAYSYDFPDALAASYLAGVLGAPILLCDTNEVPATTTAELSRLNPSAIYIVGGPGVISQGVQDALNTLPGVASVTRLGGQGREETAYLIANAAKDLGGVPTSAFVAHSGNFPDALSAGSLSAGQGVPILLTPTGALDSWAKRFLDENGVRDIIIVGGTGSVSEAAADQLSALPSAPAVTRWSGPGRYETAEEVLKRAIAKWNITPTVIGLASGEDFPDALVGGAAVGNRGGLLAITEPDVLSPAATGIISTYKATISDVEIFGGPGTIRVKSAAQALLT